jgi:hypothetical protein
MEAAKLLSTQHCHQSSAATHPRLHNQLDCDTIGDLYGFAVAWLGAVRIVPQLQTSCSDLSGGAVLPHTPIFCCSRRQPARLEGKQP